MKVGQAMRRKEREAENARRNRAVADRSGDKRILEEVAEGECGIQRGGEEGCVTKERAWAHRNGASVARWASPDPRYVASPNQLLTYRDDVDLKKKLVVWERFYNYDRPHGAHRGKTPYGAPWQKLG